MGRENRFTGMSGEDIARHYLVKNGYRILGDNIRTPLGEIDIVARHKDTIVFVEVKSRLSSSLGPPYLAVTKKKERHIIKSALLYLKKNGLFKSDWRIDIISVKMDEDRKAETIEHFENAVEDPWY